VYRSVVNVIDNKAGSVEGGSASEQERQIDMILSELLGTHCLIRVGILMDRF
jgi:hypothetical protein